jgi:signal peptidase I
MGHPEAGKRPLPQRARARYIEIGILALAAVLGAVGTKTFVAQVYNIPSGSMEPTLMPGQRVAVEKISYLSRDPERGDIVVFDGEGLFTDPAPGAHIFVKRVVGVGGDHIVCCNVAQQIVINGVPSDEASYLAAGTFPSGINFDIRVPEGKLWLMGDHRSASADSRSYIGLPGGGFVPVHRVVGRVMQVVWPLSSARSVGNPLATSGG